jgi:hypothetical protein
MKRSRLFFSFLLLISVLTGFILTDINWHAPIPTLAVHGSPPVPSDGNISNSFLIAAMDDGKDYDFTYLEDSLGLNLWHLYCGSRTEGSNNWHYPHGWTHRASNDHLLNLLS